MVKKATRKSIEQLITRAGAEYQACWKLLWAIKLSKNVGIGNEILEFQPRLAVVLFSLTRSYRAILQEQKKRISQRGELDSRWFLNRMRFLGSQKEVLDRAISVGKGIGDAFAWLFYQNDRELLDDHIAYERVTHPPPGIGGMAELHAARTIAFFKDNFIIHHCVTGLLRIGDLTLIDCKTARVSGIGEIKASQPRAGKVHVDIFLSKRTSGQLKESNDELESADPASVAEPLTPAGRARLNRQLAKIRVSLSPRIDSITSLDLIDETGNYAKDLDSFVIGLKPNRPKCCRLGNGLLLVGYRVQSRKFYSRLKNGSDRHWGSLVASDLEQRACEILIPDRKDINALRVSPFYYDDSGIPSFLPGMTHLFWWPLQRETVESIAFHEVILITVFNPAHFWIELERQGFHVAWTKLEGIEISKEISGRMLQVHGTEYFLQLMSQYLITEKAAVEILVQTQQRAIECTHSGSSNVTIHVQQLFQRNLGVS